MSGSPRIDIMRSPLGRARGLGSAREGSHHWVLHRLTAIALIPLTLWFIYSVLHLSGLPYAAMKAWMGRPVNMALMLALVGTTFHHLQAGLQVVIEDYVRTECMKTGSIVAVKLVCVLLAAICAVSVLKVGL